MKNCKIANHELYTIFEDGSVHSGITDIIMEQRINPNGYMIVSLNKNQLSVHRLVAKHFIPNPYDYDCVNHKDGDKTNNKVSNLEWCTHTQNAQHALKIGLRKGFVHVDVKREMLKRVFMGEYISDLALEVGNHPNTLSRMLREQSKKDGSFDVWKSTMKNRRRRTSLRNLELANAQNKQNR